MYNGEDDFDNAVFTATDVTASSLQIPPGVLSPNTSYEWGVVVTSGTTWSEMTTAVFTTGDACLADYNGDTIGDILDFLDFLDDFSACLGMPSPCGNYGDADINEDMEIDILDFLDFMDYFAQSC